MRAGEYNPAQLLYPVYGTLHHYYTLCHTAQNSFTKETYRKASGNMAPVSKLSLM